MKKVVFLFIFIFILLSNKNPAQEIKPGDVITAKNHSTYLTELQNMLPPIIFNHFIKGLKDGLITMPVVKKGNYGPPKGFARWTAKNKGKFKVGKDNKLIGPWKAGLPFPEPSTGAELAWNAFRRKDIAEEFQTKPTFLLFNKNGKLERTIKVYFFKKYCMGRTDIQPIPEFKDNKGLLNWKISMLTLEPFDVKGFSMIRLGYTDIYKNDDVFSYVPALRRLRRLTGADTTDPMLGSDACYDDFESWQQKLDSKMTFKMLGVKNFLVPHHYIEKPSRPFIKGDCLQTEWEIRPQQLLQINLNNPAYAYSKRIFYMDKEDRTGAIYYTEQFDMKGRRWRSCGPMIIYDQPGTNLRHWWVCPYFDNISWHTSTLEFDFINSKLDEVFIPDKWFTVKGLLRMAR